MADGVLDSMMPFLQGVYDACLQFPVELQLLKKDHDSGVQFIPGLPVLLLLTQPLI